MSHDPHPLGLLVRRLAAHSRLSEADCSAILALPHSLRVLEASQYLVREGEPPKTSAILLSGYTFRQKLTGNGDRQILGINIPGDPIDFQNLFLSYADHNVQALTRAEIVVIPRTALEELLRSRAGIASAALATVLVETSLAREWLLNIGRRDARTRLAHLLCEFAMRLDAQGLKGREGYQLPMTQEQIGDALGLTSVHVNRTLKALEAEGAVRREGRMVRFDDWAAMRRIADFSALYLHLGEPVS